MRFEGAHNYDDAVSKAAEESGIQRNYWDIFHRLHEPSVEVRRQILQSLGWNVQSFETVEEARGRLFEQKSARVVPSTVVISSSDRIVPLSYPADREIAFDFEVHLEDGGSVRGRHSISHLEATGGSERNGTRWTTYRLPLPAEVPLGYHTLTIAVDGHPAEHSRLIVCPDKAYLPESLAHGGSTAGFNGALFGLRSERNWGCGDFTDL